MKQLINALLAIFAIQTAMVAALYWPSAGLMEVLNNDELVPFNADLVEEIHIGDDKGNEAVLVKAGSRWILPDLAGLTVNPELIEGLLQGVMRARTGWPVASSVAARQRFALTDYNFRRRLTLIGRGELLGTIYLGTSPGFRRVHAKNSVQDAIFQISYTSADASAIDSDWLDKRTLQLHSPLSISSKNYSLHKQNDNWRSDTGEVPDSRELKALLLALSSVQIDGVATTSMQETLSIAVPEIKLSIETADKEIEFELFTVGEQHYIHCSDHSMFFTLSSYDFDRFTGLDTQRLNGAD
ncbi:MAG: hypothetical protein ACI8QT_001559 [Halioglobus sp.]|jgi:hypothetical protein